MNKLFKRFSEFLFPNRCPCCGELQHDGNLCEKCEQSIELSRLQEPVCKRCANSKENCSCGNFNPLFTGAAAAFSNCAAAQNGIYGLKFNSRFYSAEYFATKMADSFKKRFPSVNLDVVVIVPMTARDKRERGYDHVDLLARKVAKLLEIPYDPKIIKKKRKTLRQHKLSHSERAQNVKGAFSVNQNLSGKICLLIDDIKTTGYTLNECAKQLRLAGASEVYCLTALTTVNRSCKDKKK